MNSENSRVTKALTCSITRKDDYYANDDGNPVILNGTFNVNCNPESDGFERDVLRYWCVDGRNHSHLDEDFAHHPEAVGKGPAMNYEF